MKKYIVITTDGYTEDKDGNHVENAQVLGWYRAENKQNAIKQARNELKERFNRLIAYELSPDEII